MRLSLVRPIRPVILVPAAMACLSCAQEESGPSPADPLLATRAAAPAGDSPVTKRGSTEVTAKLLEIPEGAIFRRDLYDYATVLKYQVLQVHRGKVDGETLYVGHYNPLKPRAKVADERVPDVGGTLKAFRAEQVHRMALEVPIDDHYMGGIVDKYHGQYASPIYWAVWTDLVSE